MAFNQVVRRHRKSQGLSQEALSERADVDRTYIGLLERGQRGAGLDVARRIAEALGLALADLIAEAELVWVTWHDDSVIPMAAEEPGEWRVRQKMGGLKGPQGSPRIERVLGKRQSVRKPRKKSQKKHP